MKHFKDDNGKVFGVEDGQDEIIKTNWVEMTPEEFELFKNPIQTPEQLAEENNLAIYKELEELDRASIRDIREWISLQPNAPQTLKDRETQAISARGRLQ